MAPYQMQPPPACPALYLYPLNDTFVPKQIALGGGVRVKIGRQTNAKTVPGERNGYFDSKVLSRQHAEVWEENGKIYIKDVKSSNGTFINGDRLSAESVESEPCELKSEDIVEFGIDIVGEDNKTIIHHKVATRVFVVLTPEDAQAAAREHHAHLQHQQQALFAQQQHQHQQHAAQQAQAIARRQQGPLSGNNSQLGGLGGLGQGQTRPGSKGLSFDHILNKLQMELQRSRETGQELQHLTTAMSDIQETMGGGAIPPPPPQHQLIPPVRQPTSDPDVSAMQSQLRETQSSLQAHVDKIRALDRLVEEHEAIKREVGSMREMLTRTRSPLQLEEGDGDLGEHGGNMLDSRQEFDDDSDARSVCTIVPEEEEHAAARSVGRPKTPEPMAMLDDAHHEPSFTDAIRTAEQNALHAAEQNAILSERLEALTAQLEQAIALSQGLQNHAERASSTIAALEAKVIALEEEQRAARVLGGQPAPAKSESSSESDIAQLVKSELMREMERRWDAWRAKTEQDREADKRTLAVALEQFGAIMDSRPAQAVDPSVETRAPADSGFGAQLEKLSARVEQVSTRVESVDNRIADVDARVSDLDGLVAQVGTRVSETEDQLNESRMQLNDLRRDGRTRADAVRAISGLASDSSSSTLDAMPNGTPTLDVRKRVRKRSSRGSSGEDNSSLASSMTRASFSTRATSPSEDEGEEEDETKRVPSKLVRNPAATVSATTQTETHSTPTAGPRPGAVSIKDVPAPALSAAAAIAVVAIGVGAWMMTHHRVKD